MTPAPIARRRRTGLGRLRPECRRSFSRIRRRRLAIAYLFFFFFLHFFFLALSAERLCFFFLHFFFFADGKT